ncbi:MAG: hypothetical protein R3358_08070 [Woeseiaceae bacterium]|nr:hypothetical protein [Woeseiaceae bacterium]
MILGSAIAGQRKSTPRRLSLLVFVAWLNMAMAPCAMAFGDDHDCPHAGGAMAAHGEHQHGHHGGSDARDCADVASECCDEQSVANDSRPSFEKQDFSADFVSLPLAPDARCVRSCLSPLSTGPPDIGRCAAHPPINLLNCVFLD